jgi:NADPH-dependent ferric siderophore reductase
MSAEALYLYLPTDPRVQLIEGLGPPADPVTFMGYWRDGRVSD